jgi:hypothetical protein
LDCRFADRHVANESGNIGAGQLANQFSAEQGHNMPGDARPILQEGDWTFGQTALTKRGTLFRRQHVLVT